MKNTVKLGIIGLGKRGLGMLKSVIVNIKDVEITAFSDVYPDRMESAYDSVREILKEKPYFYTDYRDMLSGGKVDAVYISASWEAHTRIAIDSMNSGVIPAMEVGGAYSEQECWDLVRTQQKTQVPFMFMENCCYGKEELLGTALVRHGILGEISHCSGAYGHDLRSEVTHGKEDRHYRLRNYITRNCENYPTHELGPIAKLLNINRGNRMVSLVSVASKAAGLREYIKEHRDALDPELGNTVFRQGDIVDTLITCENGETIHLKLDTTLPRYYDRDFSVSGTKGLFRQTGNILFLDGDDESFDSTENIKTYTDSAKKYEYLLPDFWLHATEEQIKSGHGGMDYIMFSHFIDAVKNGREMPIDVYDAASWMVITALSAKSIALGSLPMAIPDFTEGEYLLRKPKDVTEL